MDIIQIITEDNTILCPQDKKDSRMLICNSCDQNANFYCKECKCILAVKTSLQAAKCPLEKW